MISIYLRHIVVDFLLTLHYSRLLTKYVNIDVCLFHWPSESLIGFVFSEVGQCLVEPGPAGSSPWEPDAQRGF